MTTARRLFSRSVVLALVFANPYVVSAQTTNTPAAPPSQTAAAAVPAAPVAAVPVAAEPTLEPRGFTYDAEGRRDPFVNLVRRGGVTDKSAPGARPAGLAGLQTSEVTLKGTVASQGSYVGILLGVDSKTYIVKPGDRLNDGTIRTISQDSLIVTQQVSDPLAREKQRDVRKPLRQTEEGK